MAESRSECWAEALRPKNNRHATLVDMVRRGRDLEQLTEIIEGILGADPSLVVTSPDYVVGQLSGSRRECDVTIRREDEPSELLLLLECRDRRRPQDLTWLEQLVSKAEDVAARRVVAVSSSGFSRPAKRYAATKGLELRTVDEVTPEALSLWTDLQTLDTYLRRFELRSVYADLDAPPGTDLSGVTLRANERVLRSTTTGTLHTLEEIWQANAEQIYSDVPNDGTPVSGAVRLNFDDPESRFEVAAGEEWYAVTMLLVDGERWVDVERTPLSRRYEYRADGDSLIDGVEALVPDNAGGNVVMGLHALPPEADGSRQIVASWRRSDAEQPNAD